MRHLCLCSVQMENKLGLGSDSGKHARFARWTLRLRSGQAALRNQTLHALPPVAGLSFAMGHGDNTHYVWVIEIDHREGKALEHEATRAMQIVWPALGR